MNLSAIEITPKEAMHPHLALVGQATNEVDHILTERVAEITEGAVKHKPLPNTTVSILHFNSIVLLYAQIILLYSLHNNLNFINV